MTDRDRRADARDQRLEDFDDVTGVGRDDSDRVGRVRLDEIDWDSSPERVVPYDEWIAEGSTPFPAARGRKDDWQDWPEMPTRVGDWTFRPYTTENGYLAPSYVKRDSEGNWRRGLEQAETYVRMTDRREFGEGCAAYVVTPRVSAAAASLAHPPIVQASDPRTFVERLVAHLNGIGPDEITHPRYDPALERNLPGDWEFNHLRPLSVKTTYTWSSGYQVDGLTFSWAIDAEGSTNRQMDVFAYPLPSLGEKAPKIRPDDMGIDIMPGEGPGAAAETARRMMRRFDEDPREFRPKFQDGDDVPTRTDDARAIYNLRKPDAPDVDFFEGDLVRVIWNDNFTGTTEQISGELRDVSMTEADRRTDDDFLTFTIEHRIGRVGDPGDTVEIRDRELFLEGTNRGRLIRGEDPIFLVERGG